jgi:hypothetical protein
MAAGGVLIIGALIAVVTSPRDTVGTPTAIEEALRTPATLDHSEPGSVATKVPPALADESLSSSAPAEPEPVSPGDAPSLDAPAPQPVGLRIDALDVDAPVDAYGVVAGTGQMDVPDNVSDVAWYEFGPSPGQRGSAVLAAHVDLAGEGPGVFFGLRNLEAGDLAHVTYDDGSEQAFRVVARTVYDKDELPTDVLFAKDGPPVLTLITCGGAFSRADRQYNSNVVVYAVPVDGVELSSGGAA